MGTDMIGTDTVGTNVKANAAAVGIATDINRRTPSSEALSIASAFG